MAKKPCLACAERRLTSFATSGRDSMKFARFASKRFTSTCELNHSYFAPKPPETQPEGHPKGYGATSNHAIHVISSSLDVFVWYLSFGGYTCPNLIRCTHVFLQYML